MKSKKSKPKSAKYEPPISFGRLWEIVAAIDAGSDFDSALLSDVRAALWFQCVMQLRNKIVSKKGRPPSRRPPIYIWLHELVAVQGFEQESALSAVLKIFAPDTKQIARDTIKREYRKRKREGDIPALDPFMQSVLADIAEQEKLPMSKRGE